MQNTELLDIEASLQGLVRKAYDLGRNDALKKVVDVLNTDRPGSDRLALTGPDAKQPQPAHENMHEADPANTASRPWWAWPVR